MINWAPHRFCMQGRKVGPCFRFIFVSFQPWAQMLMFINDYLQWITSPFDIGLDMETELLRRELLETRAEARSISVGEGGRDTVVVNGDINDLSTITSSSWSSSEASTFSGCLHRVSGSNSKSSSSKSSVSDMFLLCSRAHFKSSMIRAPKNKSYIRTIKQQAIHTTILQSWEFTFRGVLLTN